MQGVLLDKRLTERPPDRYPLRHFWTPKDALSESERAALLPRIAGGAGARYSAEIAKTEVTTTKRTALQLITGTTGFTVCDWSISCNGTKGFLLIELLSGTNATNEKEGTTVTPKLIDGVEGSAALTKAFSWYTAGKEPTALTLLKQWEIPLPMAPFGPFQQPLGREPGSFSVTSGKAGFTLAIRLSVNEGTPSCSGYVELEE